MTIFQELVERVSNGETFYIDFEKRTMKVGKNFLIKNGEFDASRGLFNPKRELCPMDLILDAIDTLYERYKYSLPSKRSEGKRKTYFKALPMEEIADEDLIMERREIAQCRLEGFILCMILEGKFVWNEDWGTFFWQSSDDPDLVILKQWIEE